MSDFHQQGGIVTLHRLGTGDTARLTARLEELAAIRPIALALPCHAAELDSSSLQLIVSELAKARYITRFIVGLDGAGETNWNLAKTVFQPLSGRALLLWNDHPDIRSALRPLAPGFTDGLPLGKGGNLWLCFGALRLTGHCGVIAAHDCDISTYTTELLARLCLPVADETFGVDFAKGYSARFSTQLNGRAMRLLFAPLLRALLETAGPHPVLQYLGAFRYPLSGEICMTSALAGRMRIPADWGAEVGILTETHRLLDPAAVCQVDVAERYDHKHRGLSPLDPSKGLNKLAVDIALCLLRETGAFAGPQTAELLETICTKYSAQAAEALRSSELNACINGLTYDRFDEQAAVDMFEGAVRLAAQRIAGENESQPLLPSWQDLETQQSHAVKTLHDAIEATAWAGTSA